MTEQNQVADDGQLGFDNQPEPEPQPQPEGQSPEQIPSAPEGSQDQFSVPERFQGKSAEDVAKSYVELEKLHGKANERIDKLTREMNQIKSAILQQQGQMRTVGPDRQPQYRQGVTSAPEDKGKFLDSLLGETGDEYFDSRVERKAMDVLARTLQGLQAQQAQQVEQTRNAVLQTGDTIVRSLTEELGMDYREADKMVQEELLKDPDLYNRFLYQPHTFTYDEIDKGVRELFKRGQENRAKAFEKSLKDYGGIDKETLKQLAESRKRAAQAGAPSGGASSHGDNTGAPKKSEFSRWLNGE